MPRSEGSAGAKPARIVSVGTKLAAATMALVLVVTAGIYVALSRYESESLLQAKEMAASAVTRLFADSCAAAVVFNDETAITEALATLGRNEEVEYAAIWAISKGKVQDRLGELARGAHEAPVVPQQMRLERRANRVVLFAPIRDQAGEIVAVTTVAFSRARENAAIAAVERRTLIVSGSVALGLIILLFGIARFAIVNPLGKLLSAAKKLEEGNVAEIDVHSNDEIGKLAGAFRSMAIAIQSREERINARNRDMQLVMDNVGQGFVTLDIEGKMSDERSRIVDEWFGAPAPAMAFSDYLATLDSSVGQWFDLGWASIREDILPLELGLVQLPRVLSRNDRTFEFAYRPIMNGEQLDKAIVVITDVTARVENERSEQRQREIMSIFQRVVADRLAFDEFFSEASALVACIERAEPSDPGTLKRWVHTLKGNCALFGIESVAVFCHALEDRMNESGEQITETESRTLHALWSNVDQVREQFAASTGRIEIDPQEYTAFSDDLRRGVDHDALLTTFGSWKFEPVSKRLALLGEQVRGLGVRLEKAEINVVCVPSALRLSSFKWTSFWSIFAHVIRNAVDHGVETADERTAAGKSEQATVSLAVVHERPYVVVSIHDDGRGIDWSRIRERARERGLSHATRKELEEALFTEGLSSQTEVTHTSGRGVGLTVVRELVHNLGGRVEIESETGRGTTFRFLLPESMLFEDRAGAATQLPEFLAASKPDPGRAKVQAIA